MINWDDPAVVFRDEVSVSYLQHVLGGICIWEFASNLCFDVRLLPGFSNTPRYGWVRWIYLLARVLLLASVINIFLGVDLGEEIDCAVQAKLNYAIPSLAAQAATALIALRVIAIWSRGIYMCSVAVICLLAQAASVVHTLILISSYRDPITQICSITGIEHTSVISIALLSVDVLLLATMLVGLLRLRRAGSNRVLWRLLWKQGCLWLFLAPLAGVPPTVFLFLNLNEYMDSVFLTPQMMISVIGATRMYRSLSDFTRYARPDVAPVVTDSHASAPRHTQLKTSDAASSSQSRAHCQTDDFDVPMAPFRSAKYTSLQSGTSQYLGERSWANLGAESDGSHDGPRAV